MPHETKSKSKAVKKIRVKATAYFQYYSLATLRLTVEMANEDFRALKDGKVRDVDSKIVAMYPILFEEVKEKNKMEK